MSATTIATQRRVPEQGRSPLAGTWTLVRFQLRRDRIKLPAWAAGIGLFMLYVIYAEAGVFSDDELAGATALFADPVGRMLTGPGHGFDAPTQASFVANGYGLYLMLLAALMSILAVVRHTRVEEQTGRAELVRANVVGRHTALTATVIVAVLTNVAAGTAVAVAMLGVGGFSAGGSLLLAAAVAAVGIAFAGVTTITVQLTAYSRASAGMAGAVLGVAFAVRAGGDMVRQGGSALSWFSPLAWGQQTAPFVLDRWWPLGLLVAFAAVTTAAGYVLSARRDLGASLFAVHPGPPRARPSLGTPFGLALRLGRSGIIGWAAALVVAGLVFGAFAQALLDTIDTLPDVFLEVFGADDLLAGYLAYIAMFMAFLAGTYAVLAIQGLRAEETGGRAEPVLATPVGRWRWLGANLAVTVGGVVVIILAAGLGTGAGAALVTGDAGHIASLTAAHLNYVPAILVVLGAATLLFGALPRAIPVVWVVLGYSMVVGSFGPMLGLSHVAFDLSPFEHPAQMPVEPFALAPILALTAIALAATAIGFLTLRRRDIASV